MLLPLLLFWPQLLFVVFRFFRSFFFVPFSVVSLFLAFYIILHCLFVCLASYSYSFQLTPPSVCPFNLLPLGPLVLPSVIRAILLVLSDLPLPGPLYLVCPYQHSHHKLFDKSVMIKAGYNKELILYFQTYLNKQSGH